MLQTRQGQCIHRSAIREAQSRQVCEATWSEPGRHATKWWPFVSECARRRTWQPRPLLSDSPPGLGIRSRSEGCSEAHRAVDRERPGARDRESTDGCKIDPGLLPCAGPGRRHRLSQAGVGIAGMPIWLCQFRGGQGHRKVAFRLKHLSASPTGFIRIHFQDCSCPK